MRSRFICSVLATACACTGLLFVLSGCQALPGQASRSTTAIVKAQTPGTATGSGASVTGPSNSAAPTTQVAERRTAYFPPAAPVRKVMPAAMPAPVVAASAAPEPTPAAAVVAVPSPPQPVGVEGVPQLTPAWTYERTETTLGQHQDAAGIAKVAATVGNWGALKWCGLFCILGGIAGLLYAAGHDEGYPLVCWKIIGFGIFFMMAGDNPLWLLLLLLPFGFYAAQKFGLIAAPEAGLLAGLKSFIVSATAPPASSASVAPTIPPSAK